MNNGLKTFVVTLGLSLAVFGTVYYFITESSKSVDIESDNDISQAETIAYKVEQAAAFEKLATQKADVESKAVLAAATTTESTASSVPVPVTGSNTTMALLTGLALLGSSAYYLLLGPHKLALSEFERKTIRDLN